LTFGASFLSTPPHSLYLFKLGIAPQIQDLLGKVAFTGKTRLYQLFYIMIV
jgi:hypothetical protein